MSKGINFVDIIKDILGENEYLELLKDISIEYIDCNISFEHFFDEVANKYCFIILLVGLSKKVNIGIYNFGDKKIDSDNFARKYKRYIKIIENKKFEFLKDII